MKTVKYSAFGFFLALCVTSCTLETTTGSRVDIKSKQPPAYADSCIVYNGQTYCGREQGGNGTVLNDSEKMHISSPKVNNFKADGFFTLQGSITNPSVYNYALLRVQKDGTDLQSKYFPRGNFSQTIWLPFGKGLYTVTVYELATISSNLSGEGNINGVGIASDAKIYTFKIENTRDEDGCFLYPSYFVQSDNDAIRECAKELTAGKESDEEKIKAIYDFVCREYRYDKSSLLEGMYNKQDAISVFRRGTCVCEGYVSITAALLRSIGIRAQCVIGCGIHPQSLQKESHAWLYAECSRNSIKKYRMLDATWDDGEISDKQGNFIEEADPRHEYFLLDIEANEHNWQASHKSGVDTTGNPLPDYDGKYEGTRPGR